MKGDEGGGGRALNPGFVWDTRADSEKESAQAPWDFSGAARDVAREHAERGTTTLDAKIKQALNSKASVNGTGQQGDGGGEATGPEPDSLRSKLQRCQQSHSAGEAGGAQENESTDFLQREHDSSRACGLAIAAQVGRGAAKQKGQAGGKGKRSAEPEEDDDDGFDLGDDSTDDEDDLPAPSNGNAKRGAAGAAKGANDDDDDGVPLSDSEDEAEEEAKEDMWAAPRAGKVAANVAAMVMGAKRKPQQQAQDLAKDGQKPKEDVLEDAVLASWQQQQQQRPAAAAAPASSGEAAAKGKAKLKAAAAAAAGAREVKDADDGWGGDRERSAGGASGRGKGDAAVFSAESFEALQLSRPLIKACEKLGYTRPTPIQAAVVPLALSGRDICGRAVTGSGKTAAFMLPLLERLLHRQKHELATRVLVLTPTRELAVQIQQMTQRLAQFTGIRAALVVGGLSMNAQAAELRARPEIVVATPGRIIDHLRNTHSVDLDSLAALVLDEADRLLELGFAEEVRELVRLCPKRRQTMLFSATLSADVESLAALSLQNPARLSADGMGAAPKTLREEVVRLRPAQEADKEAYVVALLSRTFTQRTIVFVKTKHGAHRLKIVCGLLGVRAAELHGDLTQAQRLAALEEFRTGSADVLIATDVAARGLDIAGVSAVISMDAPGNLAAYMHRAGRTARAGQSGSVVTLFEEKDRALLKEVAKRGRGKVAERRMDAAAVAKWREKIERSEEAVRDVLRMEKEERAERKAEMEMRKAENMIKHADEISARPARSWFMTETQKKAAAKAALEGSEARGKKRPRDDGFGPGEEEGGEEEGEQPRSAKKQKAAAGGGGKGGRKEGPGVDKLKEAKRLAAGAKALARRGLSVKQVQKQHKQREKLRQGARAAEGDGDDAGDDGFDGGRPARSFAAAKASNVGLFSGGDGDDDGGRGFGSQRGGRGGGESPAGKQDKKAGGGNKGSFKSKKRYKRR